MARIFINYRRDDSQGGAGRLFDYLAAKYSRRELFMDVDAMRPGIDFAKQLDAQVAQCHVLLAVIGPHWLEAHDQGGHRRLDNEKDYVRVELASALKRDIAVIPVLIDGAVMPSEDSLSEDLKPLARRHALELRHTRFNADADAIMHALETVVPRSHVPWRFIAPGAVCAVAIAVFAVFGPKLLTKLRAPPPPIVASVQAPAPNQPVPSVPAPAPPPPASPRSGQPPASSSQGLQAGSQAGLPSGIKLGEMIANVALRGSVFRVVEVPAGPENCQAACRAETRCVAWAYTQPPAGQLARCSFKVVIPQQFADVCCTSGVERVPEPEMREPPPIPAGLVGALRGIELEGGTYRNLGGADATPEGCQAACRADGQCLAWDYARAGVYMSDARCFLKNKSSLPVTSPCCIAGMERQVASPVPVSPAPTSPGPASPAPANH